MGLTGTKLVHAGKEIMDWNPPLDALRALGPRLIFAAFIPLILDNYASHEHPKEFRDWWTLKCATIRYGEVSLTATLHAGQIRRVERRVSESVNGYSTDPCDRFYLRVMRSNSVPLKMTQARSSSP